MYELAMDEMHLTGRLPLDGVDLTPQIMRDFVQRLHAEGARQHTAHGVQRSNGSVQVRCAHDAP